ncbi:MAG: M24 family metallopeptidase [Bacteroidetes bacterium]|nr:MAG: M24 family metallopeptidase [Bacteroidota bacterium]
MPRYQNIPSQLFIQNRKNFIEHLKPNSIAIFFSNDIMPTNADGAMGFKQNSDLFYLSGIDQEETMLIIFPDAKDNKHKEILFVRETNETIAVWEGEKLSKQKASEISGISTVYWSHQFEQILKSIIYQAEHVYLNSNEHLRKYIETETAQDRWNKKIMQLYPLHKYERSAPILFKLRAIKHSIEIDLIQQACKITEQAFRRVLKFIRPGVWEYEIEAEMIHEMIRHRSKGFAYPPIIASGKNACVLHYVENNQLCKDGDVVLIDAAAEYANYASDMTRCIPVNGKFTKRQKEVYNSVLFVLKEATKILKPGMTFEKYNNEVGKMMTEELLKLKLLTKEEVNNQTPEKPAYKKYFMHGTSHFLGLDVHDVGFFYEPMQAGMVFTCEPGIYIPEENLGIRLENNILITQNGQINLMENIPIEAEEIEEIMNSR